MFKEIKIEKFRGIKSLELKKLKKFNVFVGDNGSGKTSILDAVYIAVNPNNPELSKRTNFFRGIEGILVESRSAYFESFFWNFNLESKNNICISSVFKDKFLTKREIQLEPIFDYVSNDNKVLESEMGKMVIGLKNIFKDKEGKIENKGKFVSELRLLKSKENSFGFELKPDEKYKDKGRLAGVYLNSSTVENIGSVNVRLAKAIADKKKEDVVDFAKRFKKTISDIYLSQSVRVGVIDDDFDKGVDLKVYGDGFIRALSIFLTALNSDNNVMLLDEIENGLYWSKQRVVFEALYEITEKMNNQYFITTHSRDTIKALYEVAKKKGFWEEVNICRVEFDGEENKIVCFDEENIEYFLNNKIELR